MLSGPDRSGLDEAGLIDRLVELVLALEPVEIKQQGADEATDGPVSAPVPEPTLLAESTRKMLAQMRAVLDREAARLGADGTEGKAAVDQVALIARTLEKIDQMERLIAEDQARSTSRTLSPDEREQLRQTVRQLILTAAERLAVERANGAAESGGEDGREEGSTASRDEGSGQENSNRTRVEAR
ncbi:hypothetical protein [Hoeflea sp. IMCC20628]|uniref:hypothetical protein n=1 Tax=Hoeflea sp. IMCC20628 TaxID=1620421 RepID=UPI0012E07674|nr:hypothetical protein [Hoeflea sp. IMCC20628]